MDILLTGATGFLGSNVLRELILAKHNVTITLRENSDKKRIEDIAQCYDVISVEKVNEFFLRSCPNAIIHCATAYGRKGSETKSVIETNVVFPLMLLENAIKQGCKYFINTDTSFCKQLPSRIERGEKLYMPDYTLSKYQFSEWGKLRADEGKITFIDLRMEHIYGPKDRDDKFVPWLEAQLKANVPEINLTAGTQKRDFIHVEDAASVYPKVLNDLPKYKGYHLFEIGTGKSTTLREFVEWRKRVLKSTSMLNFGAIQMKPEEIPISVADQRCPYLVQSRMEF